MELRDADVRAAAAAARLDGAAAGGATAWLRATLAGFHALAGARTLRGPATGVGAGGMPLRVDAGPAYPMAHPLADYADVRRGGRLGVGEGPPPAPGADAPPDARTDR